MIRYKIIVAAALTCFLHPKSFAEDFRPEELPPQRAITLLKATNAGNIYYLLTTDEATADTAGSNRYLLVLENGKLRLPRQTTGFVYFDGGSTDLRFENGERLVVPTDRMPVGYLGVAQPPMMMSPDRAPYLLKTIKINDALLKRLGFAKFIAPKKAAVARRPSNRDNYIPYVLPETVQIVEFDPGQKLGYKEKDEQLKVINELDPTRIKATDRINQGAFYGHGETILIVITDPATALPLLTESLETQGQLTRLSQNLFDTYLNQFARIKADRDTATEEKKLDDVQSLFRILGELERYYLAAEYYAKYEAAVSSVESGIDDAYVGTAYNMRATRHHSFYKTILTKIRTVARTGYKTLDQIGYPAAQEVLTHTAREFDFVGLDIVRGKASVGGAYYFDLWLKFMLSDLDFVDRIGQENLNLNYSRGGIFQNFKISGHLTGVPAMGLVPHFISDRPTFLLSLFGFPGRKDRYQTSLIQYVIDADKKAAKILAWSDQDTEARAEPSFVARGSANIKTLLGAMAWTPYWLTGVDGFSVEDYQESVLEILKTLFDIAPTSLKTTGTMAALIDSSIHILNDVKNHGDPFNRLPNPAVAAAANALENRLRVHLQRAVESLARVRDLHAISACEILLSPNAIEKSRSRW